MSVRIYDAARVAFASALTNWQTDIVFASICPLDYVGNMQTDKFVSQVATEPDDLFTVQVINKTLSPDGWFLCDPIIFSDCPANVPITQIVIYRQQNQALQLLVGFPAVTAPSSKPLSLIRASSSPGLCRL